MKRGFLFLGTLVAIAAAPGPHKVVRKTAALDFSYVWPAEAVAVPALDTRFYTEAKAALAQAQKNATDDQQLAKQQKRPFNQHFYSMQWTTAGQTPRLLSLQSELGSFEGGAHPNTVYGSLLWDRSRNAAISVEAPFLQKGSFSALTRVFYCDGLNRERAKKRQGETPGLPEFSQCPKYADLAIAPTDTNKNGRFDAIQFVASPYTAGPYVEGEYTVDVPVTSKLINGIKPEFRNSFERQRQ